MNMRTWSTLTGSGGRGGPLQDSADAMVVSGNLFHQIASLSVESYLEHLDRMAALRLTNLKDSHVTLEAS